MKEGADQLVDAPKQGDYIPGISAIPLLIARSGDVSTIPSPEGVIVLSQSCDLQQGTGVAHVAPLRRLGDKEALDAKSGRTSRYSAVPELGEDVFVDLGHVVPVSHELIREADRVAMAVPGVPRQLVGLRMARRFGRPALPNELHPYLSSIRVAVRDKAHKDSSPLWRALARLALMRLENVTGWERLPPWVLRLLLVLEPGQLPSLDTVQPGLPPGSTFPNAGAAAEAVLSARTPSERLAAWQSLGASLCDRAMSGGRKAGSAAVHTFDHEVLDTDDLTVTRYRGSIELDLEDLSAPLIGDD